MELVAAQVNLTAITGDIMIAISITQLAGPATGQVGIADRIGIGFDLAGHAVTSTAIRGIVQVTAIL